MYKSLSILLFIQPLPTSADYITTTVFPDTLDGCSGYLVPVTTTTFPASSTGCVNVDNGDGNISSYWVRCGIVGTYYVDNFANTDCKGGNSRQTFQYSVNCSLTNNPSPNFFTPGNFNIVQSCTSENPSNPAYESGTLTIVEYMTPTCNDTLQDMLNPAAVTTSDLNVCQNTGETGSFLIQCNSTSAYISYFTSYGCYSSYLFSTIQLFQVGCSTNTSTGSSIAVTCSSGNTPPPSPSPSPFPPSQPSNDFWTMILDSPYLIYGASAGAGLIGGGLVVCLCICLCRRRNRKNRNKRTISTPTPFSTSIQSDEDFSDGIGTPLRSDVLPGVGVQMSSPSKGGQLNNQGLRTPLLSQTNEEGGDFNNDDS